MNTQTPECQGCWNAAVKGWPHLIISGCRHCEVRNMVNGPAELIKPWLATIPEEERAQVRGLALVEWRKKRKQQQ